MSDKFRRLLIVAAGLFCVLVFMLSPVFNFEEISVSGNLQIYNDEILERAGLDGAVNFFMFSPRRARQQVMENHFIDQVVFRRVFPNELEITVWERFLSGYIEYLEGMFLYIDENGRVIEVRSYKTEDLPVVTGLRFTHMQIGEILEVDNPAAFSTVVTFAQLLNRHDLTGVISQIDVSDPNNTRIRVYNMEVYLGDTSNAHEKISTLREIVNEWPGAREVRGFLDLREPSAQYIFRILT